MGRFQKLWQPDNTCMCSPDDEYLRRNFWREIR